MNEKTTTKSIYPILHSRAEKLFDKEYVVYPLETIASLLQMNLDEVKRQMYKGFLSTYPSMVYGWVSTKKDIMRWLGVA